MRYAKYWQYGYDMSLVKDDLIHGYRMAASYHLNKDDEEESQFLGQIYHTLGDKIEDGAIDELITSYKTLDFNDPLDEIMAALRVIASGDRDLPACAASPVNSSLMRHPPPGP